jgi:4-amino-4-deoxy-L-arabinose transferase-like glycosyltransferase
MKKAFKQVFANKKIKALLLILVFALGVGLRLWKYQFYPFAGHAEEYLFVWSGLSLIEKGVPISWNDLPVYEDKHIYWTGIAPNSGPSQGGIGVRLLKPWLDEPPLFSLIVGGISKLYGLPNFTVISTYVIRIPSLIIAFVTMIFVFLLAKRFFGYWQGILALLIYSITPVIVFGSRLAVPENLIAMLFVMCLWLIQEYLQSNKVWQRNLAVFLAALAGLAKPTGFLLVPFVAFFVLERKRWREGIAMLVVGSVMFWLPFLAYGAYFDWDLFWKVISVQGSRPAGWSSLAYVLTNPGFSIEIFLDCLIVLGFLSLVYLIFKKEKTAGEQVLTFSFVYTLLVVLISGGKHDQLTWYRYPVYPFMAISTALFLKEIVKTPSFLTSALAIPLLLGNVDLLENPFWRGNSFIQSGPYRAVFFLLLLPSMLGLVFSQKFFTKLARASLVLSLVLAVVINTWVVKSRFNILCDHEHCSLPEKINLLKPILNNK